MSKFTRQQAHEYLISHGWKPLTSSNAYDEYAYEHALPGTSSILPLPHNEDEWTARSGICLEFIARTERRSEKAVLADIVGADHPHHYNAHPSGIECIELVKYLDFMSGNAIKYIWRAGEKGYQQQDYAKAIWYLKELKKNIDIVPQPRKEAGILCHTICEADTNHLRRQAIDRIVGATFFQATEWIDTAIGLVEEMARQ